MFNLWALAYQTSTHFIKNNQPDRVTIISALYAVEDERLELSTSVCKAGVFPVSINLSYRVECMYEIKARVFRIQMGTRVRSVISIATFEKWNFNSDSTDLQLQWNLPGISNRKHGKLHFKVSEFGFKGSHCVET